MRLTKLSIFFFHILLLVYGCSTTNHAVLPKQAYHDITSHYNAYFNANEKLKNTFRTGEASHKDQFDSVLPVYAHSDFREFAAYNADLEDVIKRATMAIQLHPVANWSDDNMLLIGKSSFLKGDYDKASSSFKYITTEYKEGVDYVKVQRALGKKVGNYVKSKKKKKKPVVKITDNKDGTKTLVKEDNRPEITLWLHTPARSEALVWLIKTYTRQGKFDEAGSVVTYARSDDLFYKNFDPQLELADADLQVTRKNYAGAIDPLEKYLNAKRIRKKKRLKTRAHFVLAQCYEITGNNSKAVENYKGVLKSRPNYDMEFYAKLRMAKSGRSAASGNANVRALLARMAKDGKYKDYLDQIYYELALLSLDEGNRAEARRFLRKAIDNATANDDQRALSYLMLATMDDDDEAYVRAKFNYDTTLQFMKKNDVRYPALEERSKLLDNLVTQLNIIAGEDSLQKLAAMPREQREVVIRAALARKELEEELKKADGEGSKQQQLENFKGNGQPQSQTQPQINPTLAWYFYNATVKATGYNDFVKKWGRRKLEENWRRKNKSSSSADEAEVAEQATKEDTLAGGKEDQPAQTAEEQMEAGIPLTPEKLAKSNDRIVEACYTAGTIYKDGLENYPRATAMFDKANTLFPNHKLLLESYYNLYLIAQKLKDETAAAKYKQLIISGFPESVIARILKNPDYLSEVKRREQAVNFYYEGAYQDYFSGRLDSAWYKCKIADNLYKPNPLSAKFELLLALVLGKQNRLGEYVQALQKIANKSADAEVKATAVNLLALLNKSTLPQIDLSIDSVKRDSLNAAFAPAGVDMAQELAQLEKAKEEAVRKGVAVKSAETPDPKTQAEEKPRGKPEVKTEGNSESVPVKTIEEPKSGEGVKDTAKAAPPVAEEVFTSVYTPGANLAHYFVVYITDPSLPQSAVMSTMAKLNAFNSAVYPTQKLQTKQVVIDSKNKLLNVRQFKDGADAMAYYKSVKTEDQLFNDMQPKQFVITCISTSNFGTLLSEKDIEAYQAFFKRYYK